MSDEDDDWERLMYAQAEKVEKDILNSIAVPNSCPSTSTASTSVQTTVNKKSEEDKFDNARYLHTKIAKIRSDYNEDLNSGVRQREQQGVVIYLLDETGYRIGSTAKTETGLGFLSLCVKHVILLERNVIYFNFYGKDHVPYDIHLKVEENVHKLIEEFRRNKRPDDIIFNLLAYNKLNIYLKQQYGITAHVFRTYKASKVFEQALQASDSVNIARKCVKTLLNHNWLESGEYYIDPRIIIFWCKKNGKRPSEFFLDKKRKLPIWKRYQYRQQYYENRGKYRTENSRGRFWPRCINNSNSVENVSENFRHKKWKRRNQNQDRHPKYYYYHPKNRERFRTENPKQADYLQKSSLNLVPAWALKHYNENKNKDFKFCVNNNNEIRPNFIPQNVDDEPNDEPDGVMPAESNEDEESD